ncbi:MAG: hypothetical protein FWG54_02080 [Bacteroidetes bacterium]|nr:hypothetical protein [Bacteroidota bacterium]
MKKIILTILLLSTVSFYAFAGPFGIEMGMSLQEVTKISKTKPENVKDDIYSITPPNTNDLFEMYVVRIDPTYGVYLIKAVGKDITTTGYGTALKSTFNDLVSSIEGTYGKYKKTDYLEYGSIWNEGKDFMMGLVKEERTLYTKWDKSTGATLPSSIESIYVSANATSSSKGYVSLEYYSYNYETVGAAKKAKQSSVF